MPNHGKQQKGESGVTNLRFSMCKFTAYVTRNIKRKDSGLLFGHKAYINQADNFLCTGTVQQEDQERIQKFKIFNGKHQIRGFQWEFNGNEPPLTRVNSILGCSLLSDHPSHRSRTVNQKFFRVPMPPPLATLQPMNGQSTALVHIHHSSKKVFKKLQNSINQGLTIFA
jgi:hypothetical protein